MGMEIVIVMITIVITFLMGYYKGYHDGVLHKNNQLISSKEMKKIIENMKESEHG